MKITDIPFNQYISILKSTDNESSLELAFNDNMKNHIGTFHASAQFALAEACSGLALQTQFPDLADSVLPVLRISETKFKKPASSNITAKATLVINIKTDLHFSWRKKEGQAFQSLLK